MRLDLVNFRGVGPRAARVASLLAEWRVGAILEAIAVRDAKNGQLWLDIGGQRHPARIASGESPVARSTAKSCRCASCATVRCSRSKRSSSGTPLPTQTPRSSQTPCAGSCRARKALLLLLANLAWLAQGKNGADVLAQGGRTGRRAVVAGAADDAKRSAILTRWQTAIARSGAFLEAHLAARRRRRAAGASRAISRRCCCRSASRCARPARAPTPRAATPSTAVAHAAQLAARSRRLPGAPATFAVARRRRAAAERAFATDGRRRSRDSRRRRSPIAVRMAAAQSLLIELPVRHDDRTSVLRLRIERDAARAARPDGGDAWTVEAAMDLGVQRRAARESDAHGRRIGVQLRAESPALVEALVRTRRRTGIDAPRSGPRSRSRRVPAWPARRATPVARAARLLDVRA